MKIHGLQKMTLLDFPGHVACTVFLGQCDFRCPFCHNFELVDGTAPAIMDDEELFAFLNKRKGLLDGVAVTGGEPCIHKDLPDLLRRVREMGFQTKVDTNGNHPKMLCRLLEEGLVDYVAMDIKNCPEKYALTAGLEQLDLSNIRESIALLKGSSVAHEFRTTIVKEFHEEADFHGIGEMIRGARQYFLQSFTDRDSVPYGNLHSHAPEDIRKFAQIMSEYVECATIRGVD